MNKKAEAGKKDTVTWVKPSGVEVELNEGVHTVAKAASLSWKPKSEADAKRYGLTEDK